uniref:UBC core domain-containing protein n=1 Tax=Chenopodium quinoa TaxID=63459 RepID=A0A803MQT6_CHEQI
MINLFRVKAKQKENAENLNGKTHVKKQSAGELRLHKDTCLGFKKRALLPGSGKWALARRGSVTYGRRAPQSAFDISELNLPKSCTMSFPNGKDDLMNFEVTIRPDEGYYLGGTFVFTFQVPSVYPHEPPKVKCKTKVYHPNIDLEGNVCLNILREDWKPVLNVNTVIYGLYHLFTQPNYEDPLNHDAAAVLRDNPKMFESNVRRAMAGGYVGQTFFPRCVS